MKIPENSISNFVALVSIFSVILLASHLGTKPAGDAKISAENTTAEVQKVKKITVKKKIASSGKPKYVRTTKEDAEFSVEALDNQISRQRYNDANRGIKSALLDEEPSEQIADKGKMIATGRDFIPFEKR